MARCRDLQRHCGYQPRCRALQGLRVQRHPEEHLDAEPSDEGCGAYDSIAGINLDAGPSPAAGAYDVTAGTSVGMAAQ